MRATAWLRHNPVEAGWGLFAALNVVAMVVWPSWETIPFHFVWISLTIVYGFRVWEPRATALTLGAVVAVTGASIFADAFEGVQLWGELFEVPLMSAMFLAMVWHATAPADGDPGRRGAAHPARTLPPRRLARAANARHHRSRPSRPAAPERRRDARGRGRRRRARADGAHHLAPPPAREGRPAAAPDPDGDRRERISRGGLRAVDRGRATRVAARPARRGARARRRGGAPRRARRAARERGQVHGAERSHRGAFPRARLRARDRGRGRRLGIPPEALDRIFDRFARSDAARTRSAGGAGLGLAIVDAVAKSHDGSVSVRSRNGSTVFALRLPEFEPSAQPGAAPTLDE